MSRPRTRALPTIQKLKSDLTYDPPTGDIYRLPRPGRDSFNTRHCQRPVGTITNVGYLTVSLGRQMLLAHRLAWALYHGEWPECEIDHIDGNKLNNSISNLRLSTRSANTQNRPARGSFGFKGIKRTRSKINPFSASISGKNLGAFPTVELAAEAYARAARQKYGEHAFHPIGSINSPITFTMTTH